MQARRDAVPAPQRAAAGARLALSVQALPAWQSARCVMAYVSFGSELDTRPLLDAVLASGRTLVLPRVDRAANCLRLHQVADLAAGLAPGIWSIPEPVPGRCPPADPAHVDLVVVPGLAFTVQGARLGYGGGYYDRLLGAWTPRPTLVALALDCQLEPALPADPWDIQVDCVLSAG